MQDTLDPDDPIFPKAATRVGVRYQANVMPWEEQQAAEAHHGFGDAEAGPSRHLGGEPFGSKHESLRLIDIVERGHDIGERKHESTYEVICTPSPERESLTAISADSQWRSTWIKSGQ